MSSRTACRSFRWSSRASHVSCESCVGGARAPALCSGEPRPIPLGELDPRQHDTRQHRHAHRWPRVTACPAGCASIVNAPASMAGPRASWMPTQSAPGSVRANRRRWGLLERSYLHDPGARITRSPETSRASRTKRGTESCAAAGRNRRDAASARGVDASWTRRGLRGASPALFRRCRRSGSTRRRYPTRS